MIAILLPYKETHKTHFIFPLTPQQHCLQVIWIRSCIMQFSKYSVLGSLKRISINWNCGFITQLLVITVPKKRENIWLGFVWPEKDDRHKGGILWKLLQEMNKWIHEEVPESVCALAVRGTSDLEDDKGETILQTAIPPLALKFWKKWKKKS